MVPANTSPTANALPVFDKQGHRGARGLMPENTLPAMYKALELGVTTLEMDVHISGDGQVFLSHDAHINPGHELLPNGDELPLSDKNKYVHYQMPYAAIRLFDTGLKYNKTFPEQQKLSTYKPLLAEVFDSVQHYIQAHQLPQVFYNIETKSKESTDGKHHPAPQEFVERLMRVVTDKGMVPWVIIQSFDVRTLQVLHTQYPEVKTALLVENVLGLDANLQKLGFIPTIYSPNHKLVTPQLIEKCHQQGIKVIPWTVNNSEEIVRLRALGVDGIITDYPNLFE